MTPREELMVIAWESRRMVVALVLGDLEAESGGPARLGRPLAAGLALAIVTVAVMLLV